MSLSNKPGFFDRVAERFGLDDFDKRHKKVFIVIIILAITIFILWIVQLQKNIIYPLYGGVDPKVLEAQVAASSQNSQTTTADEATLKSRDTDHDGLSDWDELYVYHTSPYLADTDGDGISDAEEIKNGTDPNCPQGQNCFVNSDQTAQGSEQLSNGSILDSSLLQSPTATVTPATQPSTTGLSADEKAAIKQTLGDKINDPTTIRQLLLQLGMDKKTLDALSDQQILDTLNGMLK